MKFLLLSGNVHGGCIFPFCFCGQTSARGLTKGLCGKPAHSARGTTRLFTAFPFQNRQKRKIHFLCLGKNNKICCRCFKIGYPKVLNLHFMHRTRILEKRGSASQFKESALEQYFFYRAFFRCCNDCRREQVPAKKTQQKTPSNAELV